MFATQKGRSKPVRISCRRSEKLMWLPMSEWRKRSRSIAKTSSYLLTGQACHRDNLMPAGLAGSNSNGRTRHIQKFREEIDAGRVSLAVYGRGSEREFERIADLTGDCVFFCARMDFDCEGHSGGRVFHHCHRRALPQGSQRSRGTSFKQSIRVFSVFSVITLLLCPRNPQSPPARKSILLRLRPRSRGTCPSRARPSRSPAIAAPRSGHESQAVVERKAERLQGPLNMAERSSTRERSGFPSPSRPTKSSPIPLIPGRRQFSPLRHPR